MLLLVCSMLVLAGCNDDGDIDGVDIAAPMDGGDSSDNGDDMDSDPDTPDTSGPVPPVTAPYADNGTVLNILPPGQDDNGGVTNLFRSVPGLEGLLSAILDDGVGPTGLVPALTREPHFNDQLGMYDNLVRSQPGLTNEQLGEYFKPEDLRGPDDGPWETESVISDDQYTARIKRDDFGVPHIFGDTREDVEFGAGYATAQDRLFLLDVLRRAGRGELSRFLGPADFSFDRDIAESAPYRERDRTAQINRLPAKFGETGAQVIEDTRAFIAGLNAYVRDAQRGLLAVPVEYLALGVQLEEFKDEDVHAIATLIQSIFAGGGGQEQANVRLVNALRGMSDSDAQACQLWRDLRNAYDVESSVTAPEPFATQSPRELDDEVCPFDDGFASEYPGAAVFDAGSYEDYADFTTEPCGRPGQSRCPEALGNVPALPGVGVVGGALEK